MSRPRLLGAIRTLGRSLGRARAGNVATMTALVLPLGLVLAAIAVDEGALYTERREAQALVDLAAITAAGNLDRAEEAVLTALRDNGVSNVAVRRAGDPVWGSGAPAMDTSAEAIVSVVPGRYTALPLVAVERRFEPGATPANAVRVTFNKLGTRYFASSLIDPPLIGTEAVAARPAEAAFSVGSRLLRLEGGVANALLGALLGTQVSLTVMDYEGLIDAHVDVFSFLDRLSTDIDLTAATYSDVLAAEASVGQVAKALAEMPGTSPTARAALRSVANRSPAGLKLPLRQMFDLGTAGNLVLGAAPQGLSATASALDVLTAAGAIANGDRQIALDLGAALPGLARATLKLAIGEPPQRTPWYAVGEAGAMVRTAQTRALLDIEIGAPGGALGTAVRLPIAIELAFAEAKLASITCPTGRPDSVRVGVDARPGVAALRIANIGTTSLTDFTRPLPETPATLIALPLVTVKGHAEVEIANTRFSRLTFEQRDIRDHAVKTVSTHDFTQSFAASLIRDLELDVDVAGLGLGVPAALRPTLVATVGAAAPAIDTLLNEVLAVLGLSLGEADVRVHGASCGRPVLVQ